MTYNVFGGTLNLTLSIYLCVNLLRMFILVTSLFHKVLR